jgi:3-oxoacyl-[acyl-carrier protein] reductase
MDTGKFPTEEARARYVQARVPVAFFGEPYDIGHMVAFLCSPKARYITGERIHVDGGRHRGL